MSLFSFGLGAVKGEGGGGETIHIYPENELSFVKEDTVFSFIEDEYTVDHEETLEFSIEVIEDPETVLFEQQEINVDVES